jgi:DNA damage-inducible protein 1
MRLTINDQLKNITFEVDVEPTTTVDVLKLKISALQNISYNLIELVHSNMDLRDNSQTIQSLNIQPGSLIFLNRKTLTSAKTLSMIQEAKKFIETHTKDPQQLENLCEKDPEMAEAVLTEDPNEVIKIMNSRRPTSGVPRVPFGNQNNQAFGYNQQNNPAFGTPFLNQNQMINQGNSFDNSMTNYESQLYNADTQRKIEDQIQQNRLNQLQTETYENYPELFVPTEMLFIKGKINNLATEIFIDTGAQTTVISKEFAEKANILKNVDQRYKTLIMGVGNQTSFGRIWQIYVEIQNRFFVFSAVVLENFSHDVLLGLDMMKRHRCIIDLPSHKLKFGLEQVEADFLKDHEVTAIKDQLMEDKIAKLQTALNIDKDLAIKLLRENQMNEGKAIESHINNKPK